MKKLLWLAAAVSAASLSGAANAATCASFVAGTQTCFYTAGLDPQFNVTFHGDGSISANIGDSGLGSYNFQDIYYFFTDNTGLGSGSVSTSVSNLFSSTDLDFTSLDIYTGATYNGDGTFTGGTHYTFSPTVLFGGKQEFLGATDIPITALQNDYIVISGLSRGNGSYGGNATFVPTVPEPATWAMMLFGFGAVGFGMRRRKKETTRVRFAI